MARFRVIAGRVIEGDKAAMVYEPGMMLDESDDPCGHVPRLQASGALEQLPEAPPVAPPPAPRERKGRRA